MKIKLFESFNSSHYQEIEREDFDKEIKKLAWDKIGQEEIVTIIKDITNFTKSIIKVSKRMKNPRVSALSDYWVSKSELEVRLHYCNREREIREWDFITQTEERTILHTIKPWKLFSNHQICIQIQKDNINRAKELIIDKKEDEWFLVDEVEVININKDKGGVPVIQINKKYWKCDQLEGLIQLIKDLIK
jgi:hypothetical protein